ncbi:MAG: glycosyltransferase [Candidatus Hodarchaeales archaeon]
MIKEEFLRKWGKIKVFSLPWHTSHQYELLKLPFEWHYLIQHVRKWGHQARPMPKHLKWVAYYEPGKYDFALLHIDQQCLSPKIAYGKTMLFREVRGQIKDIPIIVINHGTPVYPEVFPQKAEEDGMEPTEENGIKWARQKMKEALEGVAEMVVNSYEAVEMWGWGHPIIHGLDKEEWWDLPKEPRVVTFISPAGIGDKYYGRRLFHDTRTILKEKYGIELVWIGTDKYCKDWDDYRDFLGRSLVYFNPTFGSPMPRTRTEAMFSGCCVVTTKHQGADRFIKNGINGWICKDNPEHSAKLIANMIFDYKKAVQIGQKGRETAIKVFNGERFREDWLTLVDKVLEKWKKK